MVLNNSYKPNIMLTNGVIKGDFKSFMTSYFAKNAIRFRNNTILLQYRIINDFFKLIYPEKFDNYEISGVINYKNYQEI